MVLKNLTRKRLFFGLLAGVVSMIFVFYDNTTTGILRGSPKRIPKLRDWLFHSTDKGDISVTLSNNNQTYNVVMKEHKEYQVLRDVCLDRVIHVKRETVSLFYHVLFINSPQDNDCSSNEPEEGTNTNLEGQLYKVDSMVSDLLYYWLILPRMKNVFCKARPQFKDIVYLPRTYSHAENSGHFLLDMIPYYYPFVKESQKHIPEDLHHFGSNSYQSMIKAGTSTKVDDHHNHSVTFLAPEFPLHEVMVKRNKDFLDGLGVTDILFHKGDEPPLCFKYGFTGAVGHNKQTHGEILQYFRKYFGMSSVACPTDGKSAVFIQRRGSRKILNMDALVNATISLGFKHTRVIFLEDLSVQEQMQIVHCADVLLGVQGSGMVWYKYLPEGATYIEVGYEDWVNHFFTDRASDRLDLKLFNYQCRGVAPDDAFSRKASEWFGYQGNLTQEIKDKVLVKSHEESKICHTKTIWMNSNCDCDPEILKRILLDKEKRAKPPRI